MKVDKIVSGDVVRTYVPQYGDIFPRSDGSWVLGHRVGGGYLPKIQGDSLGISLGEIELSARGGRKERYILIEFVTSMGEPVEPEVIGFASGTNLLAERVVKQTEG